jgi:putative membrane-bound dehydrogenase-like protein
MRFTFILFLLFACAVSVSADDLPPGVVNSQNPSDESLSPQDSLARMTVPDGFHVTLFAGEPDIRRPIAFDFDDRGRLWVVENYSHPEWREDRAPDRIVILEDTDQDGQFDRRKVFWDKGRYLTGIAVGHGGVWLANTPELSFIPDHNRDDIPDSEPVAILDGFTKSTNNVLNNFHWGPDGWLYGAIGLTTPSRIGTPGTPDKDRVQITRGMWRFHPIDHDFEVLAEGMVNPWGADFNEFGDLFTTNTTIVHLWHIVPGMYCQRRDNESDYPYAYGRIQSIANHLHWGGGAWHESRITDEHHSVAGGGHAHCGGMVYLGDNWPDEFRGTFFTANLHGNRLNNDRLVPSGSTYVGVHSDDFLFANDPWFRGLSVKYGPDGGVFISDWHDLGECHDNDGSHRSSGRIYKVVYGEPELQSIDLQQLTELELARLHLHRNEWHVRHARRILHERAVAGNNLTLARELLRDIVLNDEDELQKIRALWTLYVVDDFRGTDYLVELLNHPGEHVRRWAVQLLVDRGQPSPLAIDTMATMARGDQSPKVRLALASALQQLPLANRWEIAARLMSHAGDAQDPYLPLMIWYGVEPLVTTDRAAAIALAERSTIPLLRRYITRRALDVDNPPIAQITQAAAATQNDNVRFTFLQGMLDALDGRGGQPAPPSWPTVYAQVKSSQDPSLRSIGVHLATFFGDQQAIDHLRNTVHDQAKDPNLRRESLQALLKLKDGIPTAVLHDLIKDQILRRDALEALVLHNEPSTADVLLAVYSQLEPVEQQDAIGVLVTRRDFAASLLAAIGKGSISRRDISAFALQQLRAFKDTEIKTRVDVLWADDTRQLEKADQIARYKKKMTPEYLKRGDAHAGRLFFEQTCAKCHTLFGEGGKIGPDLTGSGRKKLDYVLSNLIDPSAVIDPAYCLTQILTNDGRLLSGFLVQQDDTFAILQTQEAQIRFAMNEVEEIYTSRQSMMPDGMLQHYSDEQVRDLLVYLGGSEQVPLTDHAK